MRIKEMTPEELRSLESATPMRPDLNLDEADYTGVPTVTNGKLSHLINGRINYKQINTALTSNLHII